MKKIAALFSSLALFTQVQAQDFQTILDEEVDSKIPGILVSIASGDNQLTWSGSAGLDLIEPADSLEADQTFRIASVTKTYVAASILRLMELDVLDLEDPVSNTLLYFLRIMTWIKLRSNRP